MASFSYKDSTANKWIDLPLGGGDEVSISDSAPTEKMV